MLKNDDFGSFNLNNSEKHRLSFEDIFLGTLDTYTKKNEPTLGRSEGEVHGKVCWLIAIFLSLLAHCVIHFIEQLLYAMFGLLVINLSFLDRKASCICHRLFNYTIKTPRLVN